MKRLADFKEKNNKIVGNPLPREEKRLFTENNVVNVLVDRDQKNRRVVILNMGCKSFFFFFFMYPIRIRRFTPVRGRKLFFFFLTNLRVCILKNAIPRREY